MSRSKPWFALPIHTLALALIMAAPFPAAAQEFIYTANFADQNVSAFSLNLATGKATEVPGSPFPAGEGPTSITNSPDGRFLYVVLAGELIDRPCGGPTDLLSYRINQRTGALTLIDDQVLSGVCASGVAIDPTGRFVYAASFPLEGPAKVGLIDGYRTSNGHLIPLPGTPFASPIGVADGQNPAIDNMVISRNGKVLYASDPNDAAGILIFDRDRETGTLTFRKAFNSGTAFGAIAITPSGKFLLAPSGTDMFEYRIGAHGNLKSAPGSPFTLSAVALEVDVFPDGTVSVSPNGKFVATTARAVDMQRANQDGRLISVPGSPFGGGFVGFTLAFDPSGHFVITDGRIFRVNQETGALRQVSTFTPGDFVEGITAIKPCEARHGDGDRDGDDCRRDDDAIRGRD
ncbi:MAG TPA: beta-propeller fold lactonase family protein [Candidatus Angelobacter sp.]|nr:beta-propeller fold lactonase family protein [Candidatus Angelobacter sp.]